MSKPSRASRLRECPYCHTSFTPEKDSLKYCPDHRGTRFQQAVYIRERGERKIAIRIPTALLAAMDSYCARYEQQNGTKLPRESLMLYAIKKFMKV